ncbi:MAG: M20/M25/M40 family metallo-hydrolase [Ilumatobacteraceae bacterium]
MTGTRGNSEWRASGSTGGAPDNKGQHSINLAALETVLTERGRLGFNSTILLESGEEVGSTGLAEMCRAHRDLLAADVLVASDGPRLRRGRPVVFGGTRGAINFTLRLELRSGGHHSGNWGGLLANPGLVLAHALGCIADRRGQILVSEWRPTSLTPEVRRALTGLEPGGDPEDGGPPIDTDWGEQSLTPAERVFGWNSFEVLAYETGSPSKPVNAIPPSAVAHCQLRFVVGTDPDDVLPALRRHLDANGFGAVEIEADEARMHATRLDPHDPWAQLAVASIEETLGIAPDVVPNLGGSLPNEVFTDIIGMPTVWVPHSYPACSQHAPDEHLLAPLVRDGLRMMTGLFWDIGALDRSPGR